MIESQQFDRPLLDRIFAEADRMSEMLSSAERSRVLDGRIMLWLSTEPSSRTRLSFCSAMRHLGGTTEVVENARQFSSMAKGESLEHTMRVVGGYHFDVIALRYHEAGGAARAAGILEHTPLINAGDGPGQHPTQALLDVYTIEREFGRLDGIRIALVGDLANGRTARSLCYLSSKYENPRFYFVAHEIVQMRDDIKEYLAERGIGFEEVEDIHQIAAESDVIYATRVQKERFGDRVEDYRRVTGLNVIDRSVLDLMRPGAIVMHPLPIDSDDGRPEIADEAFCDPRVVCFQQSDNGLFIRMALLKLILAPDVLS
ncbi:MAG: aspartate carbamoyltransferase [bacterium]|nr:aspartate carbamoyltransferase [bacterium]